MNRSELINNLRRNQGKTWDIIVVGGGATGMGVALDAATRGYATLLLTLSRSGLLSVFGGKWTTYRRMASAEIAPEVSHIMAEIYGFDQSWQNKQNKVYNELVLNYI